MNVVLRIAEELVVNPRQVEAAVRLLDEGSTVPFIARYRKEATEGLDDVQLRRLEERLRALRALEAERERVIKAIDEMGKLTDELRAQLMEADSLARLEDLYLPYRQKRRTKAQLAIEAGLEPLADAILADPSQTPESLAAPYVNAERGFADVRAVVEGAREILLARVAENADVNEAIRAHLRKHGRVQSRVREGKNDPASRFRDYFEVDEALGAIPSHRALAMFRGRAEEVLSLELVDAEGAQPTFGEREVAARFGWSDHGRPGDKFIAETVRLAWRVKLSIRAELALLNELRARAEEEAISVFSKNLRQVLLAAPAGARSTLGLDPGIRTGVKVAVVDGTGRVLETTTVYPHQPKNDWQGALKTLTVLVRRHDVSLIAIGNGTASRETDKLAAELIEALGPDGAKVTKVVVSEAGASVYSASELASDELPDLDVSLRGAVSIARRLQDPLAELVKIDPKSIGVGQYQHDVDQGDLARALDNVVEDCVNAVGVELNLASPTLLQRVAGLTPSLARGIVAYRDTHGRFKHRRQLLDVPRLGPKTFEQCAGFLRILDGDDPLDASSVHPEAYPVVQRILAATGKPIQQVIGDESVLRSLRPERFTDAQFGLPTVKDILAELEKPGRDPRPTFKAAKFLDGVEKVEDLKPGMRLEGVVTNVTNFGAFVDVGVHQDGLVHISQLADHFVKDPYEVVKAGDIVQVRVVEVDLPRKRIALTMRSDAGAAQSQQRPGQGQGSGPRPQGGGPRPGGQQRQAPPPPQPKKKEEPFNDAFKALLEQRRR